MESAYDRVFELVATHSGGPVIFRATEHDIAESVTDDILSEAFDQADVVEFGGHWVMRKGKYVFGVYDHPV